VDQLVLTWSPCAAARRPALAVPQAAVHPHRLLAQVRHAGGVVVLEHAHQDAVHSPLTSWDKSKRTARAIKLFTKIVEPRIVVVRFQRSIALIQSGQVHVHA
jgi:hypothetical protein